MTFFTAGQACKTSPPRCVHPGVPPTPASSGRLCTAPGAAQGSASDNGKTNAQNYYVNNRPLEGMPTLHKPSATTVYGLTWRPAGVTPAVQSGQ